MAISRNVNTDEVIAVMVDRIVDGFRPERIILFGSRARGTAGDDSDIDLLVVFPEPIDRKTMTISIMKSLADLPVGKDIVVTTTEELKTRGGLSSTILHPALQEGKVLYAA